MTETIKSPFKFLDYYDRNDADIFFGREDEEKIMYQLVRKNRFVLVYGPSGSGKTSLVQCGLARQFEPSEWIPIYIRRGNNINISLLTELKARYKLDINPYDLQNSALQLKRMIEVIRKQDLRPIYLIFDQFEELLILGNEREKATFKELLREIVEQYSTLSCNVVLLLREEYFAWLDPFEKDLQGISENRLRVEPMRAEEVKKVIQKSCAAFNITLENPERNTEQIISVLSGKNAISLPYLQVYLDQLWKTAEKKQPNAPIKENLPELKFTTDDIRAFGNFKDVLFRFLKQQAEGIQKELIKEFPGEEEDCIANILDCFVTLEGTKLPVPYALIRNTYKLDNKAPNYLQTLRPRVLKFALDKLEENRILRNDGSTFELAHDALSKLIDNQRDSKRRRENEIRMEVLKGFETWTKDPKEFLSYKKVKQYESLIHGLNLEKQQLEFFNRSKEFREDEELEKMKSVRKFNRMKFVVSFLIILLLLGFFIWNQLLNKANSDFALVHMAYNIDTMSRKEDALRYAKHIYDFKDYSARDKENLQSKIRKIAMDQVIQAQFAIYPVKTLIKKAFLKGEVDISPDGEYLFVKDDSIRIFYKGARHTVLPTKNYAYFLNNSNILLLAGNSTRKSVSHGELPGYSNHFLLFDCDRRSLIDSVDLTDGHGFLYNPDVLFGDAERPYDSYRVKISKQRWLMIPYLQFKPAVGKTAPRLERNILFNELGSALTFDAFPSAFTVSTSKQLDRFIAMEAPYSAQPKMNVFTDDGTIIESLPKIYFADFTEKGWLIYIKNGFLFLKQNERIDSVFVQKNIRYAYADGDQTYAVTAVRNDSIFVANLETKKSFGIKGLLIGSDFKTKRFVVKETKERKGYPDTLSLYSFTGKKLNSFICAEGIESYSYNIDSSSVIMLSGRDDITSYQYLYLLDRDLKVKASLGLTPNDSYGISSDGSRIFYVRDNYLTILNNNSSLVNLQDFDALHAWMKQEVEEKGTGEKRERFALIPKDSQDNFKLLFPKQRIFRIFGKSD